MSQKTPTEDTSKPGFVSAIVMKFTNMSREMNEMSPKERNLHKAHRNIRESHGIKDKPAYKFISSQETIDATTSTNNQQDIKSNVTTHTRLSSVIPNSSIDERINAEYQVIGEVSVKDRIRAFTALQQTVKSAVERPEVLKSSRFKSPIAQAQITTPKTPNHKILSTIKDDKFSHTIDRKKSVEDESLKNTTKVSELISRLNKASSIDSLGTSPHESNASVNKIVKVSEKNVFPPSIVEERKTKSSSTTVSPQVSEKINYPPKIKHVSSSSVSSSTSASESKLRSSLKSNEEYSFEYNIDAINTGLEQPIGEYTMDASMIDDILSSDDDDDDDVNDHLNTKSSKLIPSSSKECLLTDHTDDNRNFKLYDPMQIPNYCPLPKSYHPIVDKNGHLVVTLPPAKLPSIIGKSKSPNKNLTLKFDTDNITVMETYSVYEYERGDDTIDPLTASAEYEIEKKTEALDKFNVQITKDERGLGMSIVGIGLGSDIGAEKLGIYIKALTPGGASEKSQMLRVHDQLLEVDGVSLVGVTQSFAAHTLKSTSKVVNFVIGREKSNPTV